MEPVTRYTLSGLASVSYLLGQQDLVRKQFNCKGMLLQRLTSSMYEQLGNGKLPTDVKVVYTIDEENNSINITFQKVEGKYDLHMVIWTLPV